jgi:hypothetical protein
MQANAVAGRAPALVSTLHDPAGRLLPFLHRSLPALGGYPTVSISMTDQSDDRLADTLQDIGAQVEIGPPGVPGEGQRRALATALKAGHSDLFVCDFDRWLHWHDTYPGELASLPGRMALEFPAAWYVCLGRTERALATHPVVQILPETLTNRALSAVTGTRLDATAGAAWIRSAGAAAILAGSIETSKATDLEWPGLVLAVDGTRVQGAFVEGLEFETPDAFGDEIAAMGSRDAWIGATYDRPAVLRARAQLAADSIAALERVIAEP